MVLVGGVWSAFERSWGRMLGFYLIAETGFSLLAIGIHSPQGVLIYFWLAVVRYFSLLVWAAGMAMIKRRAGGSLELSALEGFGNIRPLLTGVTLVGQLSLIGTPFLAGYTAHFSLWQQLASTDFLASTLALIGNLGLLAGGLRMINTMYVLFPKNASADQKTLPRILSPEGTLISDRLFNWLMVGGAVLVLILVGTFPRIYLPWLESLLRMFDQIGL
jgi:formate hydrogenlyase subunit 3/multisubunit Na+/H+ antiporter MnhD subunit